MNRFSIAAIALVTACMCGPSASGTGLYLDLPSFFAVPDTAGARLFIRQADIQLEKARCGMLSADLALVRGARATARVGFSYPVMRTERSGTAHQVGDGWFRADYRVLGDSLGLSGLYLRGDVRIPSGSDRFIPFSGGSLDGGGGLEYRRSAEPFRFRFACTFNLVERRITSGRFVHRNHTIAAVSAEAPLGRGATAGITGFVILFRGGDMREVYMLTLRQRLAADLDLHLEGAVDVGKDDERVFNSLLSLTVLYRFPSGR